MLDNSPDNSKKRNRDTDSDSPETRELKSVKLKMTKDQEEMAKQAKIIERMIRKEQEAKRKGEIRKN